VRFAAGAETWRQRLTLLKHISTRALYRRHTKYRQLAVTGFHFRSAPYSGQPERNVDGTGIPLGFPAYTIAAGPFACRANVECRCKPSQGFPRLDSPAFLRRRRPPPGCRRPVLAFGRPSPRPASAWSAVLAASFLVVAETRVARSFETFSDAETGRHTSTTACGMGRSPRHEVALRRLIVLAAEEHLCRASTAFSSSD